MKLTDTHSHLFAEQFDKDRNEVVKRAIENGINRIVLPGIDSTYIKSQLEMTDEFPENCVNAFGLHPSHVKENFREELLIVEETVKKHKCVAIGEIGIDLYWDKTFIKEQVEAFEYQILLAKKLKLPIIIHVRNAFEEALKSVEKLNDENLTGIFHSFTGSIEQAQKVINFGGFKIGINGIVTFKNSGIDKVVKHIPPEHLVLETDSPWLAPVPKRGKRNESSYLIHIANKIAEIHNISVEKLAEITNKNADEIFKFSR